MRGNKGQSPIQYATLILVIVALVGSWMAYSSAGALSTKGLAGKKDVSKLNDRIATLEKRLKALKKEHSSIMKKIGKKKAVKKAKITVQSISIPRKVNTGEEATIKTIVKNVGEKKGSKTIRLKVAGKVRDSRKVTLKPGKTTKINLKATMEKAGDYDIRVGTKLGTISVGKKGAWEKKGPITVGAAISQSGKYERSGTYTLQGYELGVKLINRKLGGVAGRKLKLITYDDESSPTTCVKLYRKLLYQDRVDIVIGPYSSGITKAVAPLMEKAKMPMITIMAGETEIWKGKNRDWSVQCYGPAPLIGKGFVKMVKEEGAESISIVNEDTAFPIAIKRGAKNAAKKLGLEVKLTETFPKGITDYKPLARKAKSAGADAFLVCGYFPDSVGFTKAMNSVGYKPDYYMNSVGSVVPKFIKNVGDLAQGVMGPPQWTKKAKTVWLKDPKFEGGSVTNQEFQAMIKKRFGHEPDYHNASGMVGIEVLYKALMSSKREKGKIDLAYINKFLHTENLHTLWGPYGVVSSGKNAGLQKGKTPFIVQWQKKGGKLKKVVLYPKQAATAQPITWLGS